MNASAEICQKAATENQTLQKDYDILHHGAVKGVTGSCHELRYNNHLEQGNPIEGILIDCGLFQGIEAESDDDESVEGSLLATNIPFEIEHIKALVVTHVHIDHVGRIPHLLAKGFKGPIYCSEPSAKLLPLVLEDALKVGFTRNKTLINKFLKHIEKQIVPVKYGKWQQVSGPLKIKLKPAGHILGSAYVLCKLNQNIKMYEGRPRPDQVLNSTLRFTNIRENFFKIKKTKTIIFSGDLGAPHSPILAAPKSPWRCDTLVMESTYGNKNHENRKHRRQRLKAIIEKALQDQGTVLIPAFSIGRTQELLYELEELIHQASKPVGGRSRATSNSSKPVGGQTLSNSSKPVGGRFLSNSSKPVGGQTLSNSSKPVGGRFLSNSSKSVGGRSRATNLVKIKESNNLDWNNLEIIIDSPLASKFTTLYNQLQPFWDKEAIRKIKNKRNPLKFNNVLTINGHKDHLNTVQYLANTKRPAIVIAASGMCNGGRIMNYLKAMISNQRHDVLFVGYQAKGTVGRIIQKYGPAKNGMKTGYVDMDGQNYTIQAKIHTIGGYSAHAGQQDLLNFVKRMWLKPKEIRLIHGSEFAKQELQKELNEMYPNTNTWIPTE